MASGIKYMLRNKRRNEKKTIEIGLGLIGIKKSH